MNSAEQIARDVQSGSMSATSVLQMSLDAIRARNEELNVFLYVDEEGAFETASSIDARIAKGEDVGPLAGVPVALKDNLCQDGIPDYVLVQDPGRMAPAL